MTAYVPSETRTYVPMVDLTGKVGYAVKHGTGGDLPKSIRVATDGLLFAGVLLYEGVAAGTAAPVALNSMARAATVQSEGTAKAVAGAAIANGAEVQVGSDGRFITAVTGQAIVGIAEEAAVNANDTFALRLNSRRAALKP